MKRYNSGAVGELIEYLGPGSLEKRCPAWPPDVFALTGSVLHRSGAYLRAVELAAEPPSSLLGKDWPREASCLGKAWREAINQVVSDNAGGALRNELRAGWGSLQIALPGAIDTWWGQFQRLACTPLEEVYASDELCAALLRLCIVSDEASAGLGVNVKRTDVVIDIGRSMIIENEERSLCLEIKPEKICVLPKQHTPQRGVTLRSLTHNLALCSAGEVESYWSLPIHAYRDLDAINMLLLPWPLQVSATNFKLQSCQEAGFHNAPGSYRFFTFQRESDPSFSCRLLKALNQAKEHMQHVDAIVFPELALTWKEYEEAEQIALEEQALLIGGVALKRNEDNHDAPANVCYTQLAGLTAARSDKISREIRQGLRIEQTKHHRWCLDRNQIIQYGLGGQLPASKDCWECSGIRSRKVRFITLDTWLTLSVLICEDLAQQDPVADVIRAVGPNLLIALLLDGPQLRNRWSSRYASVLADDPGCSVLTLTSFGMVDRSRPLEEVRRSRSIGLWKDRFYGERELELEPGAEGCVLSLVCKTVEEFTADGRSDKQAGHTPVFGGLHHLSTPAYDNSGT